VTPLLATASWRALYQGSKQGPLDVVPVRTSLGVPRFWPEAYDAPAVEELFIPPWTLRANLDDRSFRRIYWKKLSKTGVDAILSALENVPNPEGKRLALACFEDIFVGQPCHRRDFADYWAIKTGELVPEWIAPGELVRLIRQAPEGAEGSE
jgi:hypothetical protein